MPRRRYIIMYATAASSFQRGWCTAAFSTTIISSCTKRAHAATSSSSSLPKSKYSELYSSHRILPLERPPDPASFASSDVQNQAKLLKEWMASKKSIVCITGAGMSTESSIPDYRGANGSYFRGHKPIIHHEFMNSVSHRKRYWSRSLIGYSPFANAKPNIGHYALAKLEAEGHIGVKVDEECGFDRLTNSCFGNEVPSVGEQSRTISVITQNVDTLHSRGGLKNYVIHLHGRGDIVDCQNCGLTLDRKVYHEQLTRHNTEWIEKATSISDKNETKDVLRPDGDAEVDVSYDSFFLPPCPSCGNHNALTNITSNDIHQQENNSFFKTAVVFFGGVCL